MYLFRYQSFVRDSSQVKQCLTFHEGMTRRKIRNRENLYLYGISGYGPSRDIRTQHPLVGPSPLKSLRFGPVLKFYHTNTYQQDKCKAMIDLVKILLLFVRKKYFCIVICSKTSYFLFVDYL